MNMKRNASIILMAVLAASVCGFSTSAHAQAWSETFKDEFADVNGIRLHYVSNGSSDAPLMLFLHGAGIFSYYWTNQLAHFGKDYYAVAPSLRGYYLSSRPTDPEQYHLKYLVEDVRQLAAKLNGGKPFILVGHDWGGILAYVFAMYHPELVQKLIISNAPHPQMFEREVNKNPWQQHNSEYMIHWNGFLNPGEPVPKVPNSMTKDLAARRIANSDWLQDGFRTGRFSEADREKWMTNYVMGSYADYWYLANHLTPPFNESHSASQVKHSWKTEYVTKGAKSLILKMPTMVFWGIPDIPLPTGNLTGFDRYFTDVRIRMYPGGGHDPLQRMYKEANREIRDFVEGKDIPGERVYIAPTN